MCNLYRLSKPQAAVADFFRVKPGSPINHAAEVYPGYSGMVLAGGALQAMTWGFPLVLKSKRTGQPLKPKPVNNAREDKLGTAFWRVSFAKRRCLIPVSAWAEAEGQKGHTTRTWYSLPGEDLFAVAGIWRSTAEWGDAYSMVMVEGSEQMADVHDRMPTILHQEDWAIWTEGTPENALSLCRPWVERLAVDHSAEFWSK